MNVEMVGRKVLLNTTELNDLKSNDEGAGCRVWDLHTRTKTEESGTREKNDD